MVAVGFQTLPRKKSPMPISAMAGMPEITRYTEMQRTNPTVMIPQRKNSRFMLFSQATCFVDLRFMITAAQQAQQPRQQPRGRHLPW